MTMRFVLPGLLCLCVAALGTVLDDCPKSLPRNEYLQVFENHCFYFQLKKTRQFASAQSNCEKLGGNLAVASTASVDNFLVGHLKRTYSFKGKVWIGLHDRNTENTFEWIDGTPVTYTNFANREGPRFGLALINNHFFEDCVAIDARSGLWRDYRCYNKFFGFIDTRKPYICQYKAGP